MALNESWCPLSSLLFWGCLSRGRSLQAACSFHGSVLISIWNHVRWGLRLVGHLGLCNGCGIESPKERRAWQICARLGRLLFALSALDHLRPFLGPIYVWMIALEHARMYKLPKTVNLIMLFLAKELEGSGQLTQVKALPPQR